MMLGVHDQSFPHSLDNLKMSDFSQMWFAIPVHKREQSQVILDIEGCAAPII